LTGRIVGVDFGGFRDLTLVILGIHFQCNLSLPAGGDGLIKKGDRTTSPGLDLFYQKGLVSLVKDSTSSGVPPFYVSPISCRTRPAHNKPDARDRRDAGP